VRIYTWNGNSLTLFAEPDHSEIVFSLVVGRRNGWMIHEARDICFKLRTSGKKLDSQFTEN
jgi:hypothetical protein